MSLQEWHDFGWLKPHATSLNELSNLLAMAVRASTGGWAARSLHRRRCTMARRCGGMGSPGILC